MKLLSNGSLRTLSTRISSPEPIGPKTSVLQSVDHDQRDSSVLLRPTSLNPLYWLPLTITMTVKVPLFGKDSTMTVSFLLFVLLYSKKRRRSWGQKEVLSDTPSDCPSVDFFTFTSNASGSGWFCSFLCSHTNFDSLLPNFCSCILFSFKTKWRIKVQNVSRFY